MTIKVGEDVLFPVQIAQADLIANTGTELVSPIDGYIVGLDVTVQAAVTTGGTVTVKTGSALATTVAGISLVVANAAPKGTRVSGAATNGSDTRKVAKGDRIQIASASFATAGALNGYLTISPGGGNR